MCKELDKEEVEDELRMPRLAKDSMLLTEHHENCPKCDVRGDAINQIRDLIRGIEAWASDEDGVHPECWEAYKRAKLSIGEFATEEVQNGMG